MYRCSRDSTHIFNKNTDDGFCTKPECYGVGYLVYENVTVISSGKELKNKIVNTSAKRKHRFSRRKNIVFLVLFIPILIFYAKIIYNKNFAQIEKKYANHRIEAASSQRKTTVENSQKIIKFQYYTGKKGNISTQLQGMIKQNGRTQQSEDRKYQKTEQKMPQKNEPTQAAQIVSANPLPLQSHVVQSFVRKNKSNDLSVIRKSMDNRDRDMFYHALHMNTQLPWRNPLNGNYYRVTPTGDYNEDSKFCRNYIITADLQGRSFDASGFACRRSGKSSPW